MKKKILIIEDERVLQEALSKSLETKGYELSEALTGAEGLDVAFGTHPDLILLDIILPTMSGLEVLESLRKDIWGEEVPVLIITNLEDQESMEKAQELGALDYLIKSNIEVATLVAKIEEYLS